MKIQAKNNGNNFEVQFKKYQGEETLLCPVCSHNRKPSHQKIKCFSWNHDNKTGFCHNCNESFFEYKEVQFKRKEYAVPVWQNNTILSDKTARYFESRGINQITLKALNLTSQIEWMPQFQKEVETICFNYFRDGKLINVKYRGPQKSFKLYKDAELIFYNLDAIKDSKECIITEGEIDCISFVEAGYKYAVSVPNGATTGSVNLTYLDNCIEYFENKEVIYIATDNDTNGINLKNELIRRLGWEKCRIIDFKDCKDANEFLIKYKGIELVNLIKQAKEIKIEGIKFVEDYIETMLFTKRNGKERGTTTHIEKLDKHFTHRKGEVTLWTGYNNEGKSAFLLFLAIAKAKNEGWRFGCFSPENMPITDFYDDLIHTYVGKSTDPYFRNVMTDDEYLHGAEFINDHFYMIDPDESYTIDTILDKAKYLIKRYGINSLIIDPYNQIEHQMERGEREDLYISCFMNKLKKFAVVYNISIHLVAHQVTPIVQTGQDYPTPDQYKIKGGGTFSDKADNVIIVWRPLRRSNPDDTLVKIMVSKIKKQRLVGLPGDVDMFYNRTKAQYFENQFFEEPKELEKQLQRDTIDIISSEKWDLPITEELPF